MKPIIFLKHKTFWFNTLLTLFNVVLLGAVFSKISERSEWMNTYISSDTLYLPSLYRDLFIDGNSFKGWELNGAPNFFPDMLVYFILMAILGNFMWASVIFSILQYLFIAWLFGKIFRLLFPQFSPLYILLIHIFFSFFLLESLFFSKNFLYTFHLLSNAYHTGSFVMAMLCFYLALEYIKDLRPYLVFLLFFFQVAGVLSDRLFVVTCIAPMITTTFILRKQIQTKKVAFILVISLLALLTGLGIFNYLSVNKYVYFIEAPQFFRSENISSSIKSYIGLIDHYNSFTGFRKINLYLFALSVVLCLHLYVKSSVNLIKYYSLFVLLFTLFVTLAPIISGIFKTHDHIRYNIYPFYLFPLTIPIWAAAFLTSSKIKLAGRWLVVAVTVVVVSAAGISFKAGGLESFFNYYPDSARQIDSLATRENLFCGVANYWEAKKATMFSKRGVKLYAVLEPLSLYTPVANRQWFYGSNVFNFILLNNFGDTSYVSKRLKPIRLLADKKDFKVLQVSPFVFKEEKGFLPVNIGY